MGTFVVTLLLLIFVDERMLPLCRLSPMVLTFLLQKDPVRETLFKPSLFTYIQRAVALFLMCRWHQISHRMLAGSPYPSGPQSSVGSQAGQHDGCTGGGRSSGGVHCHSHQRRWRGGQGRCA